MRGGINRDSKTKDGAVGISQDYNAIEKRAMAAQLRAAVRPNMKYICRAQETRKEKELSRKSIIDGEKQVLKIIAAIKEYKNPFAFCSTRKSKSKYIVTGGVVHSEHPNNIFEARAILNLKVHILKKRYLFGI